MKEVYEFSRVNKATDIQAALVVSHGINTEVDGKPGKDEWPPINAVQDLIGDIWELSEDFTDASDWVQPLENIDNSLDTLHQVGWQLYIGVVEQGITNPLNDKYESINATFIVASKQNTKILKFSPRLG